MPTALLRSIKLRASRPLCSYIEGPFTPQKLMRAAPIKTLSIVAIMIGISLAMQRAAAIDVTQNESPQANPKNTTPAQLVPPAQANRDLLSVEIASPEHFHRRVITIDQPFLVVLTNTSPKPLRVWRDWCSWGYQQLSFEITEHGGNTWIVTRKEHPFHKNYPDFWTLDANEPLVLSMTLSSDQWESKRDGVSGAGIAITSLRGKAVTLRAIFAAEEDDQSREHKVWTGRVTSTARRYEVE